MTRAATSSWTGAIRLANPGGVNSTNNKPKWYLGSVGVDTRAAADFPTLQNPPESAIKITSVGNTIYAAVANAKGFGLYFIEESLDGGITWAQIKTAPPNYLGGQGFYDSAILATPVLATIGHLAGSLVAVPSG